MGGIPDGKQSGAMPVFKPIKRHAEQEKLAHVHKIRRKTAKIGRKRFNAGTHGRDTVVPQHICLSLGKNIGALPVISPVDHDHHIARTDQPSQGFARRFALWQPEPEDVHGGPQRLHGQNILASHNRTSAICHDHELAGLDAPSSSQDHANCPPIPFNQFDNLGVHFEREAWKPARFGLEEIKKIPLRHHGNEWGRRIQMAELADRQISASHGDSCLRQSAMGPFQEPVQHAQLVEDFHGRGVDRVAPEIAKEIPMLFNHQDRNARSGQQQASHHSSRTPADNNDIGFHEADNCTKISLRESHGARLSDDRI